MKNPRDIIVETAGFNYLIPMYEVKDEGIVDSNYRNLEFCRGDKSDATKPRQQGVFVESLLEAIQHRLTTVNVGDLATRETSIAITKIQEALMWLEKRSSDRKIRGVEQTYQK